MFNLIEKEVWQEKMDIHGKRRNIKYNPVMMSILNQDSIVVKGQKAAQDSSEQYKKNKTEKLELFEQCENELKLRI